MLGFTADNLLRLAIVVRELESRGEDLSDLKLGILPILRRIACGELLPELVAIYAGQPRLLGIMAKLPPQDQAKVVRGELELPKSEPKLRKRNREVETKRQANVAEIARNGTPRDVGELAAELIIASDSKVVAMQVFLDLLPPDLRAMAKGELRGKDDGVLRGGCARGARAVVGMVTPAKGPRNRIAVE